MTVLPVAAREMGAAVRRPWLFWARFAVAAAALIAWIIIFTEMRDAPAAKGQTLLVTLAVIALFPALLSGVFLTADCLSEEKREGTLGLLFLTPLRGYDVVMGKMVAQSTVALFGVVSLLPILNLPLLTGGVTLAETLRLMLALLLSLAFSLAFGMLVSACSTESREAFLRTLIGLIVLVGVPVLAGLITEAVARSGPAKAWFYRCSPIFTVMLAFDSNYRFAGQTLYWTSAALVAAQSLAFFIAATVVVQTAWRVKTEPSARPPVPGTPVPPSLRRWRSIPSRVNPYFFLCLRGRVLRAGTWLFYFGSGLFWLAALVTAVATRHWEVGFVTACFSSIGLHWLGKALWALDATRRLSDDLHGGALELLLATPLPDRDIVLGQLQAFRLRHRTHLWLLCLVNLLMFLSTLAFWKHLHMDRDAFAIFAVFFLGGCVALFVDFHTLPWIGMWRALLAGSHLKATLRTLTDVIALPGLVAPVIFFLAVNATHEERWMVIGMSAWFVLCLVFAFHLRRKARRILFRDFRLLAAGGRSS